MAITLLCTLPFIPSSLRSTVEVFFQSPIFVIHLYSFSLSKKKMTLLDICFKDEIYFYAVLPWILLICNLFVKMNLAIDLHQSFIPYLIFVNKQSYAHVISFSMGLTCHPSPPPSVIYTLPNICKQAGLCTCHQLLHGVDPPTPSPPPSVIYTLPNICKQAELCTCHQLLQGVYLPPPPHPHQSFIPYLIFVNKQSYAHVISFSMGLTLPPH